MSHENYSRVETTAGSSDRTFGLVFAVLFMIIALLPLLSGAAPRYWSAVLSGALLLSALLKPKLLAWPNRGWTLFGRVLHKIVNPLVLAALFFLVITPYALVMRIFRRDHLGMTRDPVSESYWRKRKEKVQSLSRQF